MTVTRFGPRVPAMSARLGQDSVSTPLPEPPDRVGEAGVVEVPVESTDMLVQVKAAAAWAGAFQSSFAVTFDTAPTEDDTLVAFIYEEASSDAAITGWTLVETALGRSGVSRLTMWTKVAGPSEGSTVTANFTALGGGGANVAMHIAEVAATLDVSDVVSEGSDALTTFTGPTLTPSGSGSGVVLTAFEPSYSTYVTVTHTPTGSLSEYADLETGRTRAYAWFGGQEIAIISGTYTHAITTTQAPNATESGYTWAAVSALFLTGGLWRTAPLAHDGNDATYELVASPDPVDSIVRVMLDQPRAIRRGRLLVGFATAGAKTVNVYGATLADFSDEVLLDTAGLTATGSYTADDVTFALSGEYQFYRVTGPEAARIYSLELYESTTAVDLDAHEAATDPHPGYATDADLSGHVTDPTDAHDASAVSFDPTGLAHTDATHVQEALEDHDAAIAALGSPSLALDDLTDVDMTGKADGDVVSWDATAGAFVPVAPGSPTIDWGEDGDISTLDYDDTPAGGASTEVARADHVHGMPSAGGGGSGFDLDTYSIDGTYGDDFTAASLSGSWTRRNFVSGNETHQVGKAATYLRLACGARAAGDMYLRTAPGGDWTIGLAFIARNYGGLTPGFGLTVVDTNGTGVFCNLYNTPASHLIYGVVTYTAYSGAFAQVGGGSSSMYNGPSDYNYRKVWMTLRKSGTNYYTSISHDGEAFSPESPAFAWAGTVDRIGFGFGPLGNVQGSASAAVVDVDWFNKLA